MTNPKIKTTNVNDSRIYHWDGDKLPSVTSIINMLPKPGLKYWAANKVAEAAIDRGRVLTQADYNWLKRAPERDLHSAATMGSNVHDTLDRIVTGESVDVKGDERPFVDGFDQFVNKFQPEFIKTEETVIGQIDGLGYAGSFDAYLEIDGEKWLIDFKTTRSGVHPEVGIQLSAYANADKIIHPDGSDEDMPEVDGLGVLWLRPDKWKFVAINQTPELMVTFDALLKSWHYEQSWKKKTIGEVMASGSSSSAPF